MAIEKKCLRCGSTDLQPGRIQSTGLIYFTPENARFLTLKTSNVPVRANICLECGNVELVGDVHKAAALTGAARPA